MSETRKRVVGFSAVVALCAGFIGWYAVGTVRRQADVGSVPGIAIVEDAGALSAVAVGSHVLFRNSTIGLGNGHLALARLDAPTGPRYLASLRCERVDAAAGTGVCLQADRGFRTTYSAAIFDKALTVTRSFRLDGIPSRTQVAPNGRLLAITVFVSGHSYAGSDFSTLTTLVDASTGERLADLEEFAVTRDGAAFKAVDFNFWGVTFTADSNRFYATLGTGGQFFLVEGDTAGRIARVVREGVECPSLSPDGLRVAFKKRTTEDGRMVWRLAVLDLETLNERLLSGETRSVDDQVAWLDDGHILYGVADDELGLGGTSVWVVPAAGGDPARPWMKGAYSPAVVR
jgi:hypothetical protein